MRERRYNEDEVSEIFQRAAESQQSTRRLQAPSEGMTLAELQEIGRDVGIAPELVADAAHAIDRPRRSDSKTLIGLPIGVGRTIELKRHLSQTEWEQLVIDLRETFDARGTVRTEGNFRQWTNGNLQALVEPTADGDRVRLQTVKGNARAYIHAGLGFLGAAGIATIAGTLTGSLSASLDTIGILAILGAAMIGVSAFQLPAWARRRREQMEAVAGRLALSGSTDEPKP